MEKGFIQRDEVLEYTLRGNNRGIGSIERLWSLVNNGDEKKSEIILSPGELSVLGKLGYVEVESMEKTMVSELLEIRFYSGNRIFVTPDLLIKKVSDGGNTPEWIKASDISVVKILPEDQYLEFSTLFHRGTTSWADEDWCCEDRCFDFGSCLEPILARKSLSEEEKSLISVIGGSGLDSFDVLLGIYKTGNLEKKMAFLRGLTKNSESVNKVSYIQVMDREKGNLLTRIFGSLGYWTSFHEDGKLFFDRDSMLGSYYYQDNNLFIPVKRTVTDQSAILSMKIVKLDYEVPVFRLNCVNQESDWFRGYSVSGIMVK